MGLSGRSVEIGLTGYGAYVPRGRISPQLIASAWQKEADIQDSLGIREKTVAGLDEDAITMAVEATLTALKRATAGPKKIGAVFMGSESHPYAVNPSTTTVAEILGLGHHYFTADLEFACKAGSAGLQIIAAFLEAGRIDYGLAIGADKAQSRPGDPLEYATASGAAAFILGKNQEEFLAEICDYCSFNSDTPDFWRREGEFYPSHGGRFTGEKAYFYHTVSAGKNLFARTKTGPKNYDYAIFHMPNGKFPRKAAEILGFRPRQIQPGLIVDRIGNTYSACSLLGLCSVLDQAKPKQKIFLVSYGSGAGSDAFYFETTSLLTKKQKSGSRLVDLLRESYQVDYFTYLRLTGAVES